MKELFPAKSMKLLSPRLQWCKRNRVTTEFNKKRNPDERWHAWSAHYLNGASRLGVGPTEEEACKDLGVKANIRLWFEQP